jgi:hypothetical protein
MLHLLHLYHVLLCADKENRRMNKLSERLEQLFVNIAFAEAGEAALALEIMGSGTGDCHRPGPHNKNDLGCFCMGKA